MTPSTAVTARDVVTHRMIGQVQRFPELDLSPLDTAGLDGRDAALAHSIFQAVLGHWLTLEHIVQSQLSRPWANVEPAMQATLLVGAAQLLTLDRLPVHAVINEAVEWAKRNIRPKAGGMINAVLRKVADLAGEVRAGGPPFSPREFPLGDGRVRVLNSDLFTAAPLLRLAQQISHPEPLLTYWSNNSGLATATQLGLHSLVHAPIVISGIADPQPLLSAGVLGTHDEPGFFVYAGPRTDLAALLEANPAAIVHDPTAAAPVRAVADVLSNPQLIMDLCAGKGTKTRQLVQAYPGAQIYATDIDNTRRQTLRESLRDSAQVHIIEFDQTRSLQEKVDLLVLDVPCSNTGVLARRTEARYRFTRTSLQNLIDTQRQIVADAIPLLAAGGRILYSTCSIEAAENRQQAEWIAKWHRMNIVFDRITMPEGRPGQDWRHYHDGGYFALLERT